MSKSKGDSDEILVQICEVVCSEDCILDCPSKMDLVWKT
jgi:hypothetical protein